MKEIFKKYINSVLHPDEFSLFTAFISNRNNEPVIDKLIKPFWDKGINEETELPAPNPELREKIMRAILNTDLKAAQKRLKTLNWGLGIAAILIAGLIMSNIFFYKQTAPKEKVTDDLGSLETIKAPYGARTNVTLPDGSLVWLNSGSSISYFSRFGTTRNVDLQGEAFFKVAKNGSPFTIQTSEGEIEVKGTVFNVKAYSGEAFQTTLLEGSVKVREKSTGEELMLKPGQQAGILNAKLQIKDVETDLYSSWKDGKLIFRNEYLPEVTKRLERWYNVKIELGKDKRLAEISYTGTIEMESFSEVLQLLKVTAPISYTYDEKTRTIKINYKKTNPKNLNELPMS